MNIQISALRVAKALKERDMSFESALKVLELAYGMCLFALAHPSDKPFPKIYADYTESGTATVHCTNAMREYALEIVAVFQKSDTTLIEALRTLELTRRLCEWLKNEDVTMLN